MERNVFTTGVDGAWVLDPKPCINGALPQKLASVFYDLFSGVVGGLYTPLVYCGHQLVNGTNYMIICKVAYTTAAPKTAIVKVILHETLPCGSIFGDFSILSIETIVSEGAFGGYNLQPFPYMPGELSHDPIYAAFKEAKTDFEGSAVFPLAFCGTQHPSPNCVNHMFICKSGVVGSEEVKHIDIVVLSEIDNKFSFASITELI